MPQLMVSGVSCSCLTMNARWIGRITVGVSYASIVVCDMWNLDRRGSLRRVSVARVMYMLRW